MQCLSCAQETRFYGRPKGVRTTERGTTTRKTERLVFLRVSAISRPLRLFFAYFFLARQKKVCPRSDSYSVTVKTEPPVTPEKSLPHPLDAVPSAPPARHCALRAQKRCHPFGATKSAALRAALFYSLRLVRTSARRSFASASWISAPDRRSLCASVSCARVSALCARS